jgi:hypothetical protein
MIGVGDRAALRAPAQRVWCALELPAPFVLAPFELRLEIRHALHWRSDWRDRWRQFPAGCQSPLKARIRRRSRRATAGAPPEFRERILRILFGDPMAPVCALSSLSRWRRRPERPCSGAWSLAICSSV